MCATSGIDNFLEKSIPQKYRISDTFMYVDGGEATNQSTHLSPIHKCSLRRAVPNQ
jgi:hypothetical protein